MKLLITYYTRSGTTKRLAEDILSLLKEKNIETQILEIKDNKNRKGIYGWIKAGKDGYKKSLTEISHDPVSFENFDLVILGTPIWAGKIVPAIRTLIEKHKNEFKDVAFFASAGGNKFNELFIELQNLTEKKPLSVIGLQQKLIKEKGDSYINALKQFIDQVIQ